MYLPRLIEKTLKKVSRTFPAVVITGPRQSGKSTLLSHFLPASRGTYLSLDDIHVRALIQEDPKGFLLKSDKPVVLDEIQDFPEILPYVKVLIDQDRRPGQWFITGSQQFSLMKNVSESLAGRAGILTLPPFQLRERKDIHSLENFMFRSSYPELIVNRKSDAMLWYSSYLQSYLERDVRKLTNVHDLRDFEQLLKLLATRSGQELHYSNLSSDLGISVPTVRRWISVLEASYIIFLVPPYFNNYGKRIIKAPKLYFYDIGLLNYLTGIRHPTQVLQSPMAGAIFETAVISEIVKRKHAEGLKPEIYFWRSQSGIEIDLIVLEDGNYVPYEIKMASAIKPLFYKNLRYWLELTKNKKTKAFLVTNAQQSMPLPEPVENLFWRNL